MVDFETPPDDQSGHERALWYNYGGAGRGLEDDVVADLGYKMPGPSYDKPVVEMESDRTAIVEVDPTDGNENGRAPRAHELHTGNQGTNVLRRENAASLSPMGKAIADSKAKHGDLVDRGEIVYPEPAAPMPTEAQELRARLERERRENIGR